MHKLKRFLMIICIFAVIIPLLLVSVTFTAGVYLYISADFCQPNVNVDLSKYEQIVSTDSLRVCEGSSLYLNNEGIWEAYLSGDPVDRGAKYGIISKDLLKYQEDVFVNQIHEIIPSEWWVDFLHKLIIIFNRGLAKHVPEELRQEIYAMSLSCTDKYNSYGSPYVRQLNYHAAHDIGHAMQQYMLVGCSSFACWGDRTKSNDIIVGRNFDFYVGDDFARNKIVCFVEPTNGYRFASVSWPGMMGVLSGINEQGLTITLNAAKGAIPTSSAIPISLLARQILQYAKNIDEAYSIALQYKTFVSESLLIASSQDGIAAIIEKTPQRIALYKPSDTKVVCTNHYQTESFAQDEYNLENMSTSDSPYRFNRINELLEQSSPITTTEAAGILRNRFGVNDYDIGLCNEKSINQYIAHHSVIFEPNNKRFWVSTSPWQLGKYICYDLDQVFAAGCSNGRSYSITDLEIPADSLALADEHMRVCLYREQYRFISSVIKDRGTLTSKFKEDFIQNNPNYYEVYNILGDYEEMVSNSTQAVEYWKKALSLEIPRTTDRSEIIDKIDRYDKR